MAKVQLIEGPVPEKPRRRDRRSLNFSTKLTADESQNIQDTASRPSKTPSEWTRDVLLRAPPPSDRSRCRPTSLTNLSVIQMLLMNTLEPRLRGDKIAQAQITVLFHRVQTPRATQGQELLAKKSQNTER
jgi:hypothetical protein